MTWFPLVLLILCMNEICPSYFFNCLSLPLGPPLALGTSGAAGCHSDHTRKLHTKIDKTWLKAATYKLPMPKTFERREVVYAELSLLKSTVHSNKYNCATAVNAEKLKEVHSRRTFPSNTEKLCGKVDLHQSWVFTKVHQARHVIGAYIVLLLFIQRRAMYQELWEFALGSWTNQFQPQSSAISSWTQNAAGLNSLMIYPSTRSVLEVTWYKFHAGQFSNCTSLYLYIIPWL